MDLIYIQRAVVFSVVRRNSTAADIILSSQGGAAVMDTLSDDLLANILSRISLKKAARTCVLAQRWKNLWRSRTLELDSESLVTANGDVMGIHKFESLLDTLLEVRQDMCVEGIVISFEGMLEHYEMTERLCQSIAIWMYAFLLNDGYESSSVQMFSRLKTLRLVHVEIEDEAVNHFLASAPVLEELCVSFSKVTQNLQVVDPPSLRSLEISKCCNIQSLEISAANLVSLTYGGGKNSLLLKKVPKLCKLSISNEFAASYVLEPKQDSSYFTQLVELVLNLQSPKSPTPADDVPPHLPLFTSLKRLKVAASSAPGHGLRFFTLLVEASPQLVELSLEMSYIPYVYQRRIAFPSVWSSVKFDHKSLKVVEMAGFVGSQDEAELVTELIRNAPLIERVVIDTKSDYYDDSDWDSFDKLVFWEDIGARTQTESKMLAKHLEQFCHSRIQFIIT